jgi:hypothetical protein
MQNALKGVTAESGQIGKDGYKNDQNGDKNGKKI